MGGKAGRTSLVCCTSKGMDSDNGMGNRAVSTSMCSWRCGDGEGGGQREQSECALMCCRMEGLALWMERNRMPACGGFGRATIVMAIWDGMNSDHAIDGDTDDQCSSGVSRSRA